MIDQSLLESLHDCDAEADGRVSIAARWMLGRASGVVVGDRDGSNERIDEPQSSRAQTALQRRHPSVTPS